MCTVTNKTYLLNAPTITANTFTIISIQFYYFHFQFGVPGDIFQHLYSQYSRYLYGFINYLTSHYQLDNIFHTLSAVPAFLMSEFLYNLYFTE